MTALTQPQVPSGEGEAWPQLHGTDPISSTIRGWNYNMGVKLTETEICLLARDIVQFAAPPGTVSTLPRQGVDVPEGVKEFARDVIHESWLLGEVDGAFIQEEALKHGLIEQVAYDPAIHGSSEHDTEPGDPWFVFSALLARSDAAPDAVGEMRQALRDILFMRPCGPVEKTKNAWKIIEAMENRARDALARAETSQGQGGQ